MEIRTIWQTKSKWPQFNLELSSTVGGDAFLVVKSCQIANGKNGPFVSGPSIKKQDGAYFNLTFMSTGFQAAVLKKAQESQPAVQIAPKQPSRDIDDMDSDVPF